MKAMATFFDLQRRQINLKRRKKYTRRLGLDLQLSLYLIKLRPANLWDECKIRTLILAFVCSLDGDELRNHTVCR